MATTFLVSGIIFVLSIIVHLNHRQSITVISENNLEFITSGWISKYRLLLVGYESFIAKGRSYQSAILNPYDSHLGLSRLLCKLLLLGGNVALNPGPNWKYPCGKCSKPVKSNQKGILCDFCDRWYHARCCEINNIQYDELADSSCIWLCAECGLPNYSSSVLLSRESTFESVNSFTPLSPDFNPSVNTSPQLHSTPTIIRPVKTTSIKRNKIKNPYSELSQLTQHSEEKHSLNNC